MSRILIVDDQKDVVESIFQILKSHGHEVDKAYSGKDCLEKSKKPDLIFLDIMMPNMDGYAVAKELRKRYNEKIRIVYITVKPKEEVNLNLVDGYIQKPFEISQIIQEAKKADEVD